MQEQCGRHLGKAGGTLAWFPTTYLCPRQERGEFLVSPPESPLKAGGLNHPIAEPHSGWNTLFPLEHSDTGFIWEHSTPSHTMEVGITSCELLALCSHNTELEVQSLVWSGAIGSPGHTESPAGRRSSSPEPRQSKFSV